MNAKAARNSGGAMPSVKYETEAVMLQIAREEPSRAANGKETGLTAKCRLKPVAGGTAIEIGESKYLVGRRSEDLEPIADGQSATRPVCEAVLWRLNSVGVTDVEFNLHGDLEPLALGAWQGQRKVRLVVVREKNEQGETGNITKITLL